jgi:hypothetical protein
MIWWSKPRDFEFKLGHLLRRGSLKVDQSNPLSTNTPTRSCVIALLM